MPADKIAYTKGFEPWGWAVGTGLYIDDLEKTFWDRVQEAAFWALGLLGILCVSAYYLARGLINPVKALTETMERLADGDTATAIPATDQKDEIGAMARAVEVFKEALIANKAADARAIEEARAKAERSRRIDDITQTFEGDIDRLTRALSEAAARWSRPPAP